MQLAVTISTPKYFFKDYPFPKMKKFYIFTEQTSKHFFIVLVEKRREQLCIRADAVSYIKESCNFLP